MRVAWSAIGAADRVALLRHVALCLAALTAYLLRDRLEVDRRLLWIVGIAALLNVKILFLSGRTGWRRVSTILSFACGIVGWATLTHQTGGVASPFLAGLWLEIVLSVTLPAATGPPLLTLAAALALWGQQLQLGLGDALFPLLMHTGFLLVIGSASFMLQRRWAGIQRDLDDRQAMLVSRLAQLERRLEEEQAVGNVGLNVARLAHGLKNAVHSLRGFAALIEPRTDSRRQREIAEGLQGAIDGLEQIACESLRPVRPTENVAGTEGATLRAIDETIHETQQAHPDLDCRRALDGNLPEIHVPSSVVKEVLRVLLQNAAEAMNGRGNLLVSARAANGEVEVGVRDHGPGLGDRARSQLFELGKTTKPGGSGFGLFLSKRLLESHGGTLSAAPADGGGTVFTMRLPIKAIGEVR